MKPNTPEVEQDMKPYDQKECTLFGRIRNEGKYILVERVVLPAGENTFT